jgi:ABC-type uncharacterized transport system auxiliary subunit
MRVRICRYLFLLGIINLALGCAEIPQKKYYLLQYQLPQMAESKPKFPAVLRVMMPRTDSTFDRLQLVYRYSPYQLEFYNYHLWVVKPQKMIEDLMLQHLSRTNLFTMVSKSPEQLPDYTVQTDLEVIEELDSQDYWFAHLAMNIRLVRQKDESTIITYRFDQRKKVFVKDPEMVVKTLCEILKIEMDTFIDKVDALLSESYGVSATPHQETSANLQPNQAEARQDQANLAEKSREASWEAPFIDEQLARDSTNIPAGKGAIFVPAMTSSKKEPVYVVMQHNVEIGTPKMSKRFIVDPGKYRVLVGSGMQNQRIETLVEVKEGEVSVVKPSWAAVVINVVDEKNIPFRGSYELIDMENRALVGTGFGADQQQGEQLKTWLIRPGLYKIIRVGENYRARINFATVNLEAGQLTHFTLVQDKISENFLGAGVVPVSEDYTQIGNWKGRMILSGDFMLARTQGVVGKNSGNSLTLGGFLDSGLFYSTDKNFFSTTLELEENHTRIAGADKFQKVLDQIDIDSIYIYHFKPRVGPYIRFSFDANLFPNYKYLQNSADIIYYDPAGNELARSTDLSEVKLGPPFSYVNFKEGSGVNITLVQAKYADINARLGIGFWQSIVRNLWNDMGNDSEGNVNLKAVESQYREGIESALIGTLRLGRYVIGTTEFELLEPFTDMTSPIFSWQNSFAFRLSKFASLNYLLELTRDPALATESLSQEHNVMLRFSYEIF